MAKLSTSEQIERERIKMNNKIDSLRAEADELRDQYDRTVASERVTNSVADMSDAEKEALRAELNKNQSVSVTGINSQKAK